MGCYCCVVCKEKVTQAPQLDFSLGSWSGEVEELSVCPGSEVDTVSCRTKCVTAKKIPNKVESRTQPCFTPLRMLEAADVEPSKTTVSFVSSDDAKKFGWTSDLGKDLEKAIPTDQIESLCEVYKEWLPLLPTFLLKLFEEDHVYSGSVGTEAALLLRIDSLCKHLEPVQYYTCKDFDNDTEEGYAAMIIVVASVTLVFVQCDDVSIPHVLWYFVFTPTEAEDFMQLGDECLFTTRQYFGGNTIFLWGLARGKRVQGFAEFISGWFSVKLYLSPI